MHLKSLSLAVLETKTGIAKARLSRIFNGEGISENTIKRIAGALGLPPAETYRQIEEIRCSKKIKKESANG